ncbi:hypothetical protein J7K50_02145 [bacterium]|nr:hypothetical protein [bacterium]
MNELELEHFSHLFSLPAIFDFTAQGAISLLASDFQAQAICRLRLERNGNCFIFIEPINSQHAISMHNNIHSGNHIAFKGVALDGSQITSKDLIVVKGINNYQIGQELEVRYVARPAYEVVIHHHTGESQRPASLVFGLLNFVPSAGEFHFAAFNRKWAAVYLEDYQQTLAALDSQVLPRAIVSCIKVDLLENDDVRHAEDSAALLCWMLSVACANLVCISFARTVTTGGSFLKTSIRTTASDEYVAFGQYIDNVNIANGIRSFIEQCSHTYDARRAELQLDRYIHWLLYSFSDIAVEARMTALILALEVITSAHARVADGLTDEQLEQKSIQDKMKLLNGHLRFIPARFLGDNLRANVRNPLFHLGNVIRYDTGKLFEIYRQYLDIALQILFRILGYTGQYLNPSNDYKPTSVQ